MTQSVALELNITFNMLKNLVESKLITNFLIIEDKVDLSGQNLFASFLENCKCDDSVKRINLICYENSPEFYLCKCESAKIFPYNYFSHPLTWKNPTAPKTDLGFFLKNPEDLSETVFLIDSISTLAYYHGFYAVYGNLSSLKKYAKKIICLVHGDLFNFNQLEELYYLATTYIKLQRYFHEKNFKDIVCDVTYQKPGGKIIKQKENFTIKENFRIDSRIINTEVPISSHVKVDVEALTTFKLGLKISEEEKRARDELILPYVKTNLQNKGGFIQPSAHELEDDPDDDLDI